tara:strand:+ start:469 stop:885 length:417 start_codon:yes stop_codon:yes gene_type:complete
MKDLTKKDLLLILNVYQNYYNDFREISEKDLTNLYLEVAKADISMYYHTHVVMAYDRESDKSENRIGLSQQEFDEFVKDYAPEDTNGYNRKAYIIRDYIQYPYHLHQQHNDNLNAIDDEKDLVWYIINNKLTKQKRTR